MNKEEMGWRCPRKGCRQEVALRSGTFFEGSFTLAFYPLQEVNWV